MPPLFHYRTCADVLRRVGNVSPDRVLVERLSAPPTRRDLIREFEPTARMYELVDGILVEKLLHAGNAARFMQLMGPLGNHVFGGNAGMLVGGKTLLRLSPTLVRIPSLCLLLWESQDDPKALETSQSEFLDAVPDLIAEIVDERHTADELRIKREEYSAAGVKLLWYYDPKAKTMTVYPKGKLRGSKVLTEADTLDGGKVLPGFAVAVRDIFANTAPANLLKKPKKKRK